MNHFKLVSSFLVGLFSAVAVWAYDGRPNKFEDRMYGRARQLNQSLLQNCQDCSFAESPSADRACKSQYDSIYTKPEVNIHVAIGYMDDSENPNGNYYAGVPIVLNESVDSAARAGLIRQLTLPCEGDQGACGFQRHPVDQELLSKTITYHGQQTVVHIRATNASATPLFETNTGEGKGRQSIATYRSEENFFGSFSTSDLTVYTGHARGGGGPDFNPPVRLPDGSADYNGYYRVKKPGLKHLFSSLSQASAHPPLLAIIACKSDELFHATVQKAAPGIGLVTTSDLIFFEDGFTATYLVIDSFLRQECGSTFQKSLGALKPSNGTYLKMSNFLDGHR